MRFFSSARKQDDEEPESPPHIPATPPDDPPAQPEVKEQDSPESEDDDEDVTFNINAHPIDINIDAEYTSYPRTVDLLGVTYDIGALAGVCFFGYFF